MPKFVDLFIGEVRRKRDNMKLRLEKGAVSSLDEDLRILLQRHWHSIPKELPPELDNGVSLAAVDGSRGLREFSNGSRLFVVRGLATTNTGEDIRKLEAEIFMSQATDVDVKRYIQQKTEFIEIAAANEAVPHLTGSRKYILMDGSLHGRIFHLLRDSPVEGDRDFVLRYMALYADLMENCKKENIALVGISKDSRASYLRNLFLDSLWSTELKALSPLMKAEDLHEAEKCGTAIREKPDLCLQKLDRIRIKYGPKLTKLRDIALEYMRARPDFQLIMNFAHAPGYSSPAELSIEPHFYRELRSMTKDPEGFVKRHFRNALIENSGRQDELIDSAVRVVQGFSSFPTTVSFHLLFDRRSTPLRVDVPSWVLGISDTLDTNGTTDRLIDLGGKVSHRIEEVIQLLRSGYAGLTDYNVWLKRVDEEVKLHRVDMDAIYERVLEKELGLTLVHTRGYRRVKFP